jgi:predicted MFS family arabinose efflux permease
MRADVAVSRQVGGLLVLFMAGFVAITTETVPIGLLPAMSRSLHASEASIGLLVGAYALVVMMATLPLVALTSRWPRRRLLLVVMSGFAASNLIMAAAPGYAAAMVARVVAACGHGVLWSTLPAYAALLVAPHRTGKAIAAVFAANSASLALGVPLGTMAGGALGWRMPFAALAVLAILVTLGARAGLPELPGQAGRTLAISDALALPALRRILAATGLVMLGHFALFTFVAPVLLEAGLSEARIGPALFAFGLAGIIGIVAAGIAVDRAPRTALLTALTGMTIATMTVAATHGGATVVAVAAWGAAYAALPPLLQTLTIKAAPHREAGASALFIIIFNVSITAGSLLGGQLLSWKGSSSLPVAATVLTAAAAASCLSVRFRRHPDGARSRLVSGTEIRGDG